MSNYVTLIGAEDISRAGHNMRDAAERMERAASSFGEYAERLMRALDEHATRIEATQQEPRRES